MPGFKPRGTSMTTLPIATPTPILFIPWIAVPYPTFTWENPASSSRPRTNDTSSMQPSVKLGSSFGKDALPSTPTVGIIYLQPPLVNKMLGDQAWCKALTWT